MTDYPDEGQIACPSCGAMVPYIEVLRDDKIVPLASTDPTMHVPACTYCVIDPLAHLPAKQEHMRRMYAAMDRYEEEKRAEYDPLTVTALYDLIHDHAVAHTEDLLKVAEMGKLLLYEAIWLAGEQDNAEFFVKVYSLYGPVVDACMQEMDLEDRDTGTGRLWSKEAGQ